MKKQPIYKLLEAATWDELVELIENETVYGVDLGYETEPSEIIELIDRYGNLFIATVEMAGTNYLLDTHNIARSLSNHS